MSNSLTRHIEILSQQADTIMSIPEHASSRQFLDNFNIFTIRLSGTDSPEPPAWHT